MCIRDSSDIELDSELVFKNTVDGVDAEFPDRDDEDLVSETEKGNNASSNNTVTETSELQDDSSSDKVFMLSKDEGGDKRTNISSINVTTNSSKQSSRETLSLELNATNRDRSNIDIQRAGGSGSVTGENNINIKNDKHLNNYNLSILSSSGNNKNDTTAANKKTTTSYVRKSPTIDGKFKEIKFKGSSATEEVTLRCVNPPSKSNIHLRGPKRSTVSIKSTDGNMEGDSELPDSNNLSVSASTNDQEAAVLDSSNSMTSEIGCPKISLKGKSYVQAKPSSVEIESSKISLKGQSDTQAKPNSIEIGSSKISLKGKSDIETNFNSTGPIDSSKILLKGNSTSDSAKSIGEGKGLTTTDKEYNDLSTSVNISLGSSSPNHNIQPKATRTITTKATSKVSTSTANTDTTTTTSKDIIQPIVTPPTTLDIPNVNNNNNNLSLIHI